MVKHDFVVRTSWHRGREEIGKVKGDVISEQISIPSSLGSNGTRTNPGETLVVAASSYHITSLAATLERARFANIHLETKSIGSIVFKDGKFKMEKITHYPTISLTEEEKTRLNKRLPKLLDIADHHCMISNSIRDNVEIKIQATIQDEN